MRPAFLQRLDPRERAIRRAEAELIRADRAVFEHRYLLDCALAKVNTLISLIEQLKERKP